MEDNNKPHTPEETMIEPQTIASNTDGSPNGESDARESAILSKTERQWAMGCHLVALCGVVIPLPAANVIGPLVLWLIKREEGEFIDSQGKESLNFQISIFIYIIGCFILSFIGVGFLLMLPLAVFDLVCVIIAAIKASDGEAYRYPACIRFIK